MGNSFLRNVPPIGSSHRHTDEKDKRWKSSWVKINERNLEQGWSLFKLKTWLPTQFFRREKTQRENPEYNVGNDYGDAIYVSNFEIKQFVVSVTTYLKLSFPSCLKIENKSTCFVSIIKQFRVYGWVFCHSRTQKRQTVASLLLFICKTKEKRVFFL